MSSFKYSQYIFFCVFLSFVKSNQRHFKYTYNGNSHSLLCTNYDKKTLFTEKMDILYINQGRIQDFQKEGAQNIKHRSNGIWDIYFLAFVLISKPSIKPSKKNCTAKGGCARTRAPPLNTPLIGTEYNVR